MSRYADNDKDVDARSYVLVAACRFDWLATPLAAQPTDEQPWYRAQALLALPGQQEWPSTLCGLQGELQ
jgi:hypothetical protein